MLVKIHHNIRNNVTNWENWEQEVVTFPDSLYGLIDENHENSSLKCMTEPGSLKHKFDML